MSPAAAIPAAARRSGFGDACLVAGADDLFVDGIAPTPKTLAAEANESDLLVATIALLRSGNAERVKAALAPLQAPVSHYGVAAAWMAAYTSLNPASKGIIAEASVGSILSWFSMRNTLGRCRRGCALRNRKR